MTVVSLFVRDAATDDQQQGTMQTAAPDVATCLLAELIQHIHDTHHTYLRRELPEIWERLREAAQTPGRQSAEIRHVARLFSRFRSVLDSHLRKEEVVLFPFIERLERSLSAGEPAPAHVFGPLRLPIEILEGEHAMGDQLLDQMRPIWRGWSEESGGSPLQHGLRARMVALEADMSRHVHIEDDVLFPRTVALEGR
jgi:regulator of cell morphogenesis and NO signaling